MRTVLRGIKQHRHKPKACGRGSGVLCGAEQIGVAGRFDAGRILFPLLLALLLFLAYSPTLSGEFILDDRPLIQKNPYVTRPHSIISYLSQVDGKKESGAQGETGTGYYRPLIQLTYWLDYKIWGMNGAGFRLSNLLYHLLACILLWMWIKRLIDDGHVSFWIAVIFALHPVNTEAVSWVSSRNNVLVAVFGLASLHLFVKMRETGKGRYGFFSLIFFAGALLSKEFALALLPVFFLWSFSLGRREKSITGLLLDHLPFALILCAYLLLRYSITGLHPVSAADETFWSRILFAPYLVLRNTQMILLPLDLHSLIVRYPGWAGSWQAFAGISFMIMLFILLWRERGRPLFRFALLSYLCTLGPILHIFPIPSPTLISMRWLYFPMIFLLMGFSPDLKGLLRAKRRLSISLLCLVVGCFGSLTYMLNEGLWHDEERFFSREVEDFRNDYYSGGFAEVLHQKGDYRGAEEQFLTAIRTGNRSAKDLINYGALLVDTGRAGDALPVLQSALSLDLDFAERAELHNNLGMAEFHLRKGAKAILHFQKAVAYEPRRALFWSNLGGAYGSAGDHFKATKAFERALEMEPDSCSIRKGLALTLIKMQDYAGALSAMGGTAVAHCDPEFLALREECLARTRSGSEPARETD